MTRSSKSIKATRAKFSNKEFCEIENFDLTVHEGTDKVFVGKAEVSLISPGTEIAIYKQQHTIDTYPGYATVYKVLDIKGDHPSIGIGDRILSMTPHQSHAVINWKDAVKIPENLSSELAVFARIINIPMTACVTTTARAPQTVIINGLGIIGNLGAQLFQACGFRVVCCEKDFLRQRLVQDKGEFLIYSEIPDIDQVEDTFDRAALCLDNRCDELDILKLCDLMRPKGEIVLTGVPWKQRTDVSAFDLLHKIFHKYIVLRSGWEWELPLIQSGHDGRVTVNENMENCMYFLKEKKVIVNDLYEAILPEDLNNAYQNILLRKAQKLTYLIDWRNY